MAESYSKKRVLLILVDVPNPASSRKRSRGEGTIEHWIDRLPELSLVASFRTKVLTTLAVQEDQPRVWQLLAKLIAEHYATVDGFVIVQSQTFIEHTGAALSLMLERLGKPVVLVSNASLATQRGRPAQGTLSPELTLRSTLVNGLQLATLDVGDVVMLNGNVVYRAATYASEGGNLTPIGRIDFGMKLGTKQRSRRAQTLKLRSALKTRILSMMVQPGAPFTLSQLKDLDGILLYGAGAFRAEQLHQLAASLRAARVPVGVYRLKDVGRVPGIFLVHTVTPVMALVKFMWALGQAKTPKAAQKLLDADIAGEFLTETGGRA